MSFEPRSEADLVRLIDEYPLAWVVSAGAAGFGATPLPLLAETGESGRITALFGHFALSNPQVTQLKESPRAKILFMGPHGYVSPEPVSKPGWAPTWNYATAQFEVDIEFRPQDNDAAVARLVARMERDRRVPWQVTNMGERYGKLIRHIVAFRGHVRETQGRFKLGQDETPQTLAELLGHLNDSALLQWMKDFNPPREAEEVKG
jgi:transcriptional regulator